MDFDWTDEEYIAKKALEDEQRAEIAKEQARAVAEEEAAKQKSAEELYETLDKISQTVDSYMAYFVTVANLAAKNRKPEVINLIQKTLEHADPKGFSYVFRFERHTFILLIKQSRKQYAQATLSKIKALFPRDPAVMPKSPNPLFKVFYLTTEGKLFRHEVAALLKKLSSDTKEPTYYHYEDTISIDINNLYAVMDVIDNVRINEAIRLRPIAAVQKGELEGIYFHEFYFSDAAVSKKMKPNVDLKAEKWLHTYLKKSLELKLMDAVQSTHTPIVPAFVMLPLSLDTLFRESFDIFNFALKSKGLNLIVGITPQDILSNPVLYGEAKSFLKSQRHRILLNSLSAESLPYVDITDMNLDFVKISWSEKLPEVISDVKKVIETIGADKVILSGCDTEDVITWGAGLGIKFFEGDYTDAMVGNYITESCVLSKCTAAECMSRYCVFSGALREKCKYPDVMNDPPVWISRF